MRNTSETQHLCGQCIPHISPPHSLACHVAHTMPWCWGVQTDVKRDLITATAGISCVASFLMGVAANLPVAAAPGMGLNAYFAYNVVGTSGSGQVGR